MSNRIYDAFDSVRAEEDLKDKTLEFLEKRVYKKQKRPRYYLKYAIPAICCLIAVLGFTGYSVYTTPVAAISIDVNPSVEFGVNRFDRVVTVECYNDDAEKITDNLRFTNLTYENAITKLLENMKRLKYLKKDSIVSISVISDDDEKSTRMQQRINDCTGHGKGRVRCQAGKTEDMHHAHEAGLSYGKYKAFLELQELDPSVSVEDVKGLSMRQIQDRIDECKGQTYDGEGEQGEKQEEEQDQKQEQKQEQKRRHGEKQNNGNGHRMKHGHTDG